MAQQVNHNALQDMYKEVWNDGPYTGFDMIKYLIEITKVPVPNRASRPATMQDFLANPQLLRSFPEQQLRAHRMDCRLMHLFLGRTGLCTSFAMKLVCLLEMNAEPGTYDFAIWDLDDHRLARCRNTTTLIDSSARKMHWLPSVGNNKELRIGARRWSCNGESLEFQNGGRPTKRGVKQRQKEALVSCLRQLANTCHGSFLCLFRGHKYNNTPGFDGAVTWKPREKTVMISWWERGEMETRDMVFGPTGTPQTNTRCRTELDGFLRSGREGINRRKQFECIENWHWALWQEALVVWGYPRVY